MLRARVDAGGWQKGGRGSRLKGKEMRSGNTQGDGEGIGGGGGGARLRKEAASEQRGNKGLVSPLWVLYCARSTVDAERSTQCKRRRIRDKAWGLLCIRIRYLVRHESPVAGMPVHMCVDTPHGFGQS